LDKETECMPSKNIELISKIGDSISFSILLNFKNSAIVIPGLEERKKVATSLGEEKIAL
jgi:hypothetical protein